MKGKCIPGLFLCLMAISCSAFAEAVLNRGVGGDPDSLDPHLAMGNTSQIILMDLFEGLYTLAADGAVIFGAAQAMDVDATGQRFTFTLREGLRWSDGRPLTAIDFVFAFRRLYDPTLLGVRGALGMDVIAGSRAVLAGEAPPSSIGVSAPGPRELVIELARPIPYLPSLLATTAFLPVPEHAVQEHGAGWVKPEHHVSNGPFKLKSFVLKEWVEVERNKYFRQSDQVRLDRIFYKPVDDPATGMRQFRTGELDILLGFPRDRLGWIKENIPDALRLNDLQGVYLYLFNLDKPEFEDRRVRRALSLALDRETVTQRLLANGERPAYRLLPPSMAAQPYDSFAPDLGREARIAEARELLRAAGYGPNRPLRFELKFDGSGDNRRIAVAAAQMWKPLGVEVALTSVELGALAAAARRGEYDLLRWAGFAAYDDPTSFLEMLRCGSASNRNGYCNPDFDRGLEAANRQMDPVLRAGALTRLERIAVAEQPFLPVYFFIGARLVNPKLSGWVDHPKAFNLARYLAF